MLKQLNQENIIIDSFYCLETIGSIAYLSEKSKELKEKVICGFNLTCCGDRKKYAHIQSPFW